MSEKYLDPEIANEGMHADAFGEWAPAVEEARVPTYDWLKGTKWAKYFPKLSGRPYQHQTFPCFLYHPTFDPVRVDDVKDADGMVVKKAAVIAKEKFGCEYRPSTRDEITQGFPPNRWVYTGEWRAAPFDKDIGFKPHKPDTGKHLVASRDSHDPAPSADMIGGIVAAVLAKMNPQGGSVASPESDPDYLEFQAFKAWKAAAQEPLASSGNALAIEAADERELWEEEAKAKGIKVDGRWSLERLKAEVEKAS